MKMNSRKLQGLWIVIFLGFLATGVISLNIYFSQKENAINAFRKVTQEQAKILQKLLDDSLHSLNYVDVFFRNSHTLRKSEFDDFAEHYMSNFPFIERIKWVVKVGSNNRDEFETYIQTQRNEPFQVKDLDSEGALVASSYKEGYFPIVYVKSKTANDEIIGLDLNDIPIYQNILRSAGELRNIVSYVATGFDSQQGSSMNLLVVAKPIYFKPQTSSLLAPDAVMIVEMRIGNLIQIAFENEKSHKINMDLFDISVQGKREFLFSSVDKSKSNYEAFEARELVHVANRTWEMIAQPQHMNSVAFYVGAILVLIFGCGFTGVIGFILFINYKREDVIEKKIEQRTTELKDLNERLRQEISLRNKVEEMTKSKFHTLELMNQSVSIAAELSTQNEIVAHSMKVISQLRPSIIFGSYRIGFEDQKVIALVDQWESNCPIDLRKLIGESSAVRVIENDSSLKKVIETKKMIWVDAKSQEFWGNSQMIREVGIGSELIVPITVFNRVSVIMRFLSQDVYSPEPEVIQTIEVFVGQIGRMLERKEAENKLREEKERLQLFQNVTVTREMEIIELKKESNELYRRLGSVPPYDLSFLDKSWSNARKSETDNEHGSAI